MAAKNTCLLCRNSSEQMRLWSARIVSGVGGVWGAVRTEERGDTVLCVLGLLVCCD